MKSIKTDISKRDKLYYILDNYCRSLIKKSISYQIDVFSEFLASITLQIVGKKATIKKKIILCFDKFEKQWIAVCNATEYYLQSLSEFLIILKSKIQKLSGYVNKY